jgi:hypothetical protein
MYFGDFGSFSISFDFRNGFCSDLYPKVLLKILLMEYFHVAKAEGVCCYMLAHRFSKQLQVALSWLNIEVAKIGV